MPKTGFLDRVVTTGAGTLRHQVYLPPEFTPERRWPVILFLHGAGERGADGVLQTQVGLGPALRRDPARFPAVVVFPQARAGASWRGPMTEAALAALDRAQEEFGGDPERVYLTGISMGGYGTWRLALEHPRRFAALVPVCGGLDVPAGQAASGDPTEPDAPGEAHLRAAEALRHVPIWVFHGSDDQVIPAGESRRMVAALRRAGGDVRYTEYPAVRHNSWDPAYAEPELMPWLLAKRRGGG